MPTLTLQNVQNLSRVLTDASGADAPRVLPVDGGTFANLFPGEQPVVVTQRGTFETLTPSEAARLLSEEEVDDILENDTAADALDWVDLSVAYAVLDAGGMEDAAALFREGDTTVSEFLSGVPDGEGLLVHLAKCAVVNAVRVMVDPQA